MHYVIVVHGIGEQRKNETVLNVINRFAEASRGLDKGELDGILTLGKATGQTGKEQLSRASSNSSSKNAIPPWLEFRGIPQPDLRNTNPQQFAYLNQIPFYGEDVPKDERGQNIRFVDLHWADIMQNDAKQIVQPVNIWAKGLMGRLIIKTKLATCEGAMVPPWIIKVLSNLIRIFEILQTLMGIKVKAAEYKIFTDFLGDVQLYGEYSITRGKAVRRFHRLIARIEEEHKVEMEEKGKPYTDKPTYTIIAHSLGTIMSLDSLFYALVKQSIRTGQNPSETPNLPFPSYYTEEDTFKKGDIDYTNTHWIERIENFVTLGSPIDKYLVMWWLNYKYLVKPDEWKTSIKTQIKHFNYCDELDPVGHSLDIVKQTPAYKEFFIKESKDKEIDVVFNRYTTFGAAHNEYWKDNELFKVIYKNTVARKNDDAPYEKVKRFNFRSYIWLLATTYAIGPLIICAIAALSFEWIFSINTVDKWVFGYQQLRFHEGHDFQTIAMATVILVTTLWIGSRWIKMTILGRQIQRKKAKKMQKGRYEKPIREFFGWFIIVLLIVVPPSLIYYALSDMSINVFEELGIPIEYKSFSFKWFVAITYGYLAWNFFQYKCALRSEKFEIKNYKSFSDPPCDEENKSQNTNTSST